MDLKTKKKTLLSSFHFSVQDNQLTPSLRQNQTQHETYQFIYFRSILVSSQDSSVNAELGLVTDRASLNKNNDKKKITNS